MRYKILIVPDKVKGSDIARLRCRVTIDGKITSMLVGEKVDVSKWSQDAQRCKANTTHLGKTSTYINKTIDGLIADITSVLDGSTNISIDDFKRLLAIRRGKAEADGDMVDNIYNAFTIKVSKEREWNHHIVRRTLNIQSHLREYKQDARITDIGIEYLDGLYRWYIDRGLKNSSINKFLSDVKIFLRWLEDSGRIGSEWRKWKPTLKKVQRKIIFLDWEELMLIKDVRLDSESLCHVRDVFCLCCFTGLRYSDVKRLTHANILDDRISIVSKKDSDSLEINLNRHAREILDRYKNWHPTMAMPVVACRNYNIQIKKVARLVGLTTPTTYTYYKGNVRIDETKPKCDLISTHTARRTFICNALSLGIPPNVVMKWTGHSDYAAMKPYIDIIDATKKEMMDKFNR